jgi:hypothetical protein
MDRYDPEVAPDSREWLALDEGERLLLVEEYHRDARISMPSRARRLHAAIHTIVENQLALEDQTIVRATLERLMEAGLTRHNAIHAVGSVLSEHIYDLLHMESLPAEGHAPYYAALQQLTVEKWRGGDS